MKNSPFLEELTVLSQNNTESSLSFLLKEILWTLPGNIHIKNNQLRYVLANKKTLDLFNYKTDKEIIGKNIHDVSKKIKSRWPKGYAEKINELDHQVLTTAKPITNFYESPYLDNNGKLLFLNLHKIPLFDNKKNTIGLLTYSIEAACPQDLFYLKETYKLFYKNKRTALEAFLKHLNLKNFLKSFNYYHDAVTDREIDCLILSAKGKKFKEIAQLLLISPRTVEAHLSNLKNKLSYPSYAQLLADFNDSIDF